MNFVRIGELSGNGIGMVSVSDCVAVNSNFRFKCVFCHVFNVLL